MKINLVKARDNNSTKGHTETVNVLREDPGPYVLHHEVQIPYLWHEMITYQQNQRRWCCHWPGAGLRHTDTGGGASPRLVCSSASDSGCSSAAPWSHIPRGSPWLHGQKRWCVNRRMCLCVCVCARTEHTAQTQSVSLKERSFSLQRLMTRGGR